MHTAGPDHVQGQVSPAAARQDRTLSTSRPPRREEERTIASHRHATEKAQTPGGSQADDERGGHHATARERHSDTTKATDDDASEVTVGAATTPSYREEEEELVVVSEAEEEEEEEEVRRGVSRRRGLVGAFFTLLAEGISSCCDLRDALGRTALHEAAEGGDSDVAKILLGAGACPDPRCRRDLTPLMLASRSGHEGFVRLLLRAGAGGADRQGEESSPPAAVDEWRSTALHHAASGGHAGVVSVLLDAGFQREQCDEAGLTPAERSARAGHASSPAATRRLLGGGAGGRDRGGKLVHDYANMVAEDVGIVRGLVDGGAFLDWQDETGGETALHRVARFDHLRIAEVLLRAGADVNLRNVRGGSPLHVAASTGCARVMAALLEAGADREARMDNGRSPLHLAVINDKPDAVLLLLRAGADTEHRDFERGQTPLSEASEYALAPIIRLLLEAGADVESRSAAGLSALHWACRFNSPDSVAALLAAGADPEAVETAAITTPNPPGAALEQLKAADVIGFGDPSRAAENPRRPFVGEEGGAAERRLDPAARSRVARLLHDARKDRAWRRRGWLVVLVKRRDDYARASAGGENPSVVAGGGVVVVDSSDGLGSSRHGGGGGGGVKEANVPRNVPRDRKKRARGVVVGVPQESPGARVDSSGRNGALAAGDPPSRSLEGALNGLRLVGADDVDATGVDKAGGRDSANLLHAESPGGMHSRSRLVAGTVEALLELASVEGGVFRNVLSYV